MKNNRLCELIGVRYPIIQAGMVWVSGGKLAAAAANAGVLGVIGAGSMKPDLLKQHLEKARSLSPNGKLAVNIPLLYKDADKQIKTSLEAGIDVFITSAGSPKKWTKTLQESGAKVIHVTSTPELAKKCEDAGVDAVVAEGFEAGGHNGRDEITTLALIPQVVASVDVPVVAAGGIGQGSQMLAAFAMGADGVQIGTRFAATRESSAHENFKNAMLEAGSGSTRLMMKNLVPVRLLKNQFFADVEKAEAEGASTENLRALLGKGRARDGMLHGDLERGELEIGQVVAEVNDIPSCEKLVQRLISEYEEAVSRLPASLG